MSGVIFNNNDFTDQVKIQFRKIESMDELVALLNFIDKNVNQKSDEKQKILLKSLYYIIKSKDKRYTTFSIPKKMVNIDLLQLPNLI